MGILCRIFALRDYHCWDITEPLTRFLERGVSQIPETKKPGDCFVRCRYDITHIGAAVNLHL
jgi:hypothetical protein